MTTQKPTPNSKTLAAGDNVVEFPQSRLATDAATLDRINRNELTSVKALTSFVAHNKNMPEDVVRAYLNAEFNVADAAGIRRDDYERVIKFLVNLQIDLMLN